MSEENKERKLRIEIDQNPEIQKLREELEDQKQVTANVEEEKEDLVSKLTMIAEKEVSKKCSDLGIDRTKFQDDQKLLDEIKFRERKRNESGSGIFNNVYAVGQQTGKLPQAEKAGNPDEGFETVPEMIQYYREQAKNGDKNSRAILNALTDKMNKSGNHEWEFVGKLKDTRKPVPDSDAKETAEQYQARLAEWKRKQREMWKQVK